MAPHEEAILRQAKQAGRPIPEKIANKPELQNELQLFFDAFFDLDTTRSHAMALTAISWLAIAEYCRLCGFDEEVTEDMHYLIRRMDNEHLKYLKRKQPSK